jgi:replicative DNA helicase
VQVPGAASTRPASELAEKVILGSCLVDEQALADASEQLELDDFSLDSHRKIYAVIFALAEAGLPVDVTTVSEMLRSHKQLDAIGGLAYLFSLSEGLPRKLQIAAYVKIVKDKAVLRSILTTCEIGAARAADQAESGAVILADMETSILELTQVYSQQAFASLLDAVKTAGSIDEYIGQMCDPLALTGLATGFAELDELLGGLQPAELIILAGRPSQGKSALMMGIASNVVLAHPDKVVAVFSLEMSKESLHRRMLASLAGVNSRRAQAGRISAEERRKIAGALLSLADKKLLIDDSASLTPIQMRAKCRRLQQQEARLDLIVVDYLQLLGAARPAASREQEVASASRGLKALAKELQVPVLAVAAIGRASEKHGDKRPLLSDLRESGQIEFDADVVLFLHREAYYRPDDEEVRGLAEVIVAKARNGPTGKALLAYAGDTTRFSNLERGATPY